MVNRQALEFVTFDSKQVQVSHADEITTVTLFFDIADGYYIQSNKVENENMIPTSIEFDSHTNTQIVGYDFILITDKAQKSHDISPGAIKKSFEVEVKLKKASNQNKRLAGKLSYQTCDGKKCYFPRELQFDVSLKNRE